MVETPINVTESFQIYQKLKKNNKILGMKDEQFIFVYRVYKIYAAKKNEYVYPWEKLLRDWRLKDNTEKTYLCVINANRIYKKKKEFILISHKLLSF